MSRVGPVDHIARLPLPWRLEADRTECGKSLADYPDDRIVTVAEVDRRIADLGKIRASMTVCVTCMDTSARHQPDTPQSRAWRSPTLGIVVRELEGLEYATPPMPERLEQSGRVISDREVASERYQRRVRAERELEAIAALIAAHRDEFDGYLDGMADTVNLADRAAQRRRRTR